MGYMASMPKEGFEPTLSRSLVWRLLPLDYLGDVARVPHAARAIKSPRRDDAAALAAAVRPHRRERRGHLVDLRLQRDRAALAFGHLDAH